MSKQKVNLANLVGKQPAKPTTPSMDEVLLGPLPTTPPAPAETPEPTGEEKIRFTNALPPATFRRLQQYTFWAHETIGDVLDEALLAYLEGKPEADRAIPEKQAKRRRLA